MKLLDGRTCVTLRSILAALDFSSTSEAALNYAAAVARRYGSRIYLAHIIRSSVVQFVAPEAEGVMFDQVRLSAEEQMAKVMISGRLRGIPHQVLLGHGDLWTALSKMIEENEVDLIVVGTHGRTGLRKLILGSAAEVIFRLAPCPVLTVGPKVPGEAPDEVQLRRVLFATDFSPISDLAADYAFSLAQEHQARLSLIHIVPDVGYPLLPDAVQQTKFLIERLRALVPADADLWCEAEYEVRFGTPAEGILLAAEQKKADLIVLGTRRPVNARRETPPATAYKVASHAPCPVLTVRG